MALRQRCERGQLLKVLPQNLFHRILSLSRRPSRPNFHPKQLVRILLDLPEQKRVLAQPIIVDPPLANERTVSGDLGKHVDRACAALVHVLVDRSGVRLVCVRPSSFDLLLAQGSVVRVRVSIFFAVDQVGGVEVALCG